MLRRDFDFALPERLIAQYPLAERRDSRLLCLERSSGRFHDCRFAGIVDEFEFVPANPHDIPG